MHYLSYPLDGSPLC